MNFQRVHIDGIDAAYHAVSGPWQFLVLQDMGKWSTSYRLVDPKAPVSASRTIRGPFDDFSDATAAADDMLSELRRLS